VNEVAGEKTPTTDVTLCARCGYDTSVVVVKATVAAVAAAPATAATTAAAAVPASAAATAVYVGARGILCGGVSDGVGVEFGYSWC
jgi:hypothetical protein